MYIHKMHWRGLLEPRPTSWKSFLESDLKVTDDFMPRSKEEQAWLDVAPVGREFGSPDFERLMDEDFEKPQTNLALLVKECQGRYDAQRDPLDRRMRKDASV